MEIESLFRVIRKRVVVDVFHHSKWNVSKRKKNVIIKFKTKIVTQLLGMYTLYNFVLTFYEIDSNVSS